MAEIQVLATCALQAIVVVVASICLRRCMRSRTASLLIVGAFALMLFRRLTAAARYLIPEGDLGSLRSLDLADLPFLISALLLSGLSLELHARRIRR